MSVAAASSPSSPGPAVEPVRDPVWEPDVLLAGHEATPLGPATLVRRAERPAEPRGVVLHVHGYNDYYFQEHLTAALTVQGFACYAVDLRRAGRSVLREPEGAGGLPPHFATSLGEFGADLDAAAAAVRRAEPGLPLAVHAHSTGGLTASVWASVTSGAGPDALVLDSPFLDLTGSWLARQVNLGVVGVLGRVRPMKVVSAHPSVYATFQHRLYGGRWDFDVRLKRPDGQPVRAAWLRTVRRAHVRVARGLGLTCPVLVARSARSGPDSPDNPSLDAQDTVLDTRLIGAVAPRLGADVHQLVVPDGVHDLCLSAPGPRETYLAGVGDFLRTRMAPR
ncbi:serine aminopeptidase domain-containing protein [Isoptericola jiangsuensis]|uniref:serine aminopeptidase domain-containing protein n=1 Tax=Isoptericola jiangsuensis TaxID=548579 RepID=UPI003AB0F3A4